MRLDSSRERLVAMFLFAGICTVGTPLLAADRWRSEQPPAAAGKPFLLVDIWPGPTSSSPGYLMKFNDLVLFGANDKASGYELWRTDGTESGTYLLGDTAPGPGSGLVGWWEIFPPRFGVPLGDVVVFAAGDSRNSNRHRELWRTDGTIAGTVMVTDIFRSGISSFGKLGDVALFGAGTTGRGDIDLWGSDGTEAGTALVADPYGMSGGREFVELDGQAIFVASHIVWGSEPFITDGTEAGTHLLADINPFPDLPSTHAESSYPANLTRVGEHVFFTADDEDHGRELWLTDGTTAGTEMVLDIRPGAESSVSWAPAVHLVPGGRGVFFIADDGVHGHELWTSDGTAIGTYMVEDIAPGAADGIHDLEVDRFSPHVALVGLEGRVFFAGDDGVHGSELWVSDGTEAGTALVEDILPGPAGSEPYRMMAAAGRLFFSADDGVHGREPWSSDGTEPGTWMLDDLRPGDGGSLPPRLQFVSLGNLVLFHAIDDEHGSELWAVEPPPLCRGRQATVYVDGAGIIRGGLLDGQVFAGVLHGSAGDDVIAGTDGDDTILAHSGDDLVCGGRGNDVIHGHLGNDVLDGGEGLDRLDGGPGAVRAGRGRRGCSAPPREKSKTRSSP